MTVVTGTSPTPAPHGRCLADVLSPRIPGLPMLPSDHSPLHLYPVVTASNGNAKDVSYI
jgi:hypothetical protein